jgi:hypothetical protein
MSNSTGRSVMVQGRIVWSSGDLFKGKPKLDMNTKQQRTNAQGDAMFEYGFGLAIPKTALQQVGAGEPGEVWGAMHEEAYTLYPSKQLPPGFAMKFKDGDGVDPKGVSYANRAGHKDHIILACTTTIPIKWFKYENGENFLVNEGIKCGDYVNVQLQIKAHQAHGQGKAGLYLNPMAVQLIGYGEAIVNTPSGNQIFGTVAPPMPPGASQTPVAPQGQIVPTPGNPVQQSMPMPGAAAAPVQQPAAPAPHYGVLPEQPAAPAMPGFPVPGVTQ